jgi:hypothetical protein
MNGLEKYIDDPEIANEPMPLREVHAIRLMMHDETKDMTPAEMRAYYAKAVREAQEKYGVKISHPEGLDKRKIV